MYNSKSKPKTVNSIITRIRWRQYYKSSMWLVMPAASIYGTTRKRIRYRRRYWKKIRGYTTKKGRKVKPYKAHRWKKTTRLTKRKLTKRYTFYGSKEDIQKAKEIMEKEKLIPRAKYEDGIDAEKFITDPRYRKRHSTKGEWIEFEEKETP